MTKLLNKPLKTFIVFTCVVLACSIPAYFYLIESIWLDELDDHNQTLKEQIQNRFKSSDQAELDAKIFLWNQIQGTSQIIPVSVARRDCTYITEKEISDQGQTEMERFRGLRASIALNGKPYSVSIETNVEEVHETVFAISVITCLFMGLLITGFILLNRRLSKRIWTPFSDTLKKLKDFDLNGDGKIDFLTTDIEEFSELNATLKKLIDNNLLVYKQQKEFTQNASHELQTPLALLKTKIDLLIQDGTLTTEQRKIIESLDSSVARVSRINKNLLLLAGIENKKYETEQISLSNLLHSVLRNFTDIAENNGCRISANIREDKIVNANESLVEILITNLLSNTLRHGIENSIITVVLNDATLSISNAGKISLIENKLFKRFSSATSTNPGTGLGLAIVKEICKRYGWQVSYTFRADQHHFSILF